MTPTATYRRALATELRETAQTLALENGQQRSRTLEETRWYAGFIAGLQAAADTVETFMREDDDE